MDNIIHILVLCESIELADFNIWSINHFLFNVSATPPQTVLFPGIQEQIYSI
jgi:hypothetical protein